MDRYLKWCSRALLIALVAVPVGACSSVSTTSTPNTSSSQVSGGGQGSKLIVVDLPFACSIAQYVQQICQGMNQAAAKVPAGYHVVFKSNPNYADVTGFSSMIKTTLLLHPAALIVYPDGSSAQVPVLKQACAAGVKVLILDTVAQGLDCQSEFVGTNDYNLGYDMGAWLVAHPGLAKNKQIGVVTDQPGVSAAVDDRLSGFTKAVTAGGYQIVATVATYSNVTSMVRNMLTAHPDLGTLFNVGDVPWSAGTEAALRESGAHLIVLSCDGQTPIVDLIGSLWTADNAQDPIFSGNTVVNNAVKLLEGNSIPATVYAPTEIVTASNKAAYLAAGGLTATTP
jgi:ABC-type sugar transport system substrate-binding protein